MTASNITQLLANWREGDEQAFAQLMPLVYDQLHRLARSYIRNERLDHTLQATALVNEAFLKLVEQDHIDWKSRAHFLGFAAHLMRHILVDYARARSTAKRGGALQRVSIEAVGDVAAEVRDLDFVALDEALDALALIDAQQARIVEMRFFGGLTCSEIAEVLAISLSTVNRDWKSAKAFLKQEMSKGDEQ